MDLEILKPIYIFKDSNGTTKKKKNKIWSVKQNNLNSKNVHI